MYFHFPKICARIRTSKGNTNKSKSKYKKVEELTMKKTFFEKLSTMLTGYYKSFSMDF